MDGGGGGGGADDNGGDDSGCGDEDDEDTYRQVDKSIGHPFSRCPLCLEFSQYYVAFVASCGLQTTARLDCSTILCIGLVE